MPQKLVLIPMAVLLVAGCALVSSPKYHDLGTALIGLPIVALPFYVLWLRRTTQI